MVTWSNDITKYRQMLIGDSGRTSIHISGNSADEPLYAYFPTYYDASKEEESDTSDKSSTDNSDTDNEKEPDWQLNPILKVAIPNPHE